MEIASAAGIALGAAAAALAAGDRLEFAGAMALKAAGPAGRRWRGMADVLDLPPGAVERRAAASAAILAAAAAALAAGGVPALAAAFALAAVLPFLSLERGWSARGEALERELPWLLDFVTLGVQAGLDFEIALDRASRVRPGPLSAEVSRLLARIRMGVGRRTALLEWGGSAQIPSVRAMAGAMAQADALGTGVAQVLQAQAETARARRLHRAEAAAQRAPVKLLLPLVICFFPITFLVILGPILLGGP